MGKVKMIARMERRVTVAWVNQKEKLEEWNLEFRNQRVAAEWEELLRQKKMQALEMKAQQQDQQTYIEHLLSIISSLEQDLASVTQ